MFVRYVRDDLDREPVIGDFTLDTAIDYMRVRRHGRTPTGGQRARSTLSADARALRAASKWLVHAGVTRTPRLTKLAIPAATPDLGRVLREDEVRALFTAAAGVTTTQLRNSALLAVLLDGGMRISEFARLDATDYDPRTGALRIWRPGKRGVKRVTAMGHTSRELLARARGMRRGAGPLFNETGGGGTPMSADAVRSLLVRLADRAGLERVSPQDFRRTSSTLYELAGLDPDLQRLSLGWSKIRPDARLRYIVLSDAELASLVVKCSPVERVLARQRRRAA